MSNSPLRALRESEEYNQESIVIKLMRFSELEKRAYEKQRVRDRVEREAKSLIETTGNRKISLKLGLLNRKWLSLRDHIRKERLRLDHICKLWRDFENMCHELRQWIDSSRICLQEDQNDLKSTSMIEKELSMQQVSFSLCFVCFLLSSYVFSSYGFAYSI